MLFSACFFISVAIVLASVVFAVLLSAQSYSRRGILQPMNILICGVFLCAAVLFFPIYVAQFKGADDANIRMLFLSTMLSLHNAIRLFIVDGEFSIISDYTAAQSGWIADAYNIYGVVLFVIAPVLTFGTLLTLFESITARRKYILGYFKDAYIFSELNERSLILAKSLKQKHPHCLIAFTDVYRNEEERTAEQIEQAKKLKAILFREDITLVDFHRHSKKAKLYFFLIGEDESENVNQLISLSKAPNSSKEKDLACRGYDYPADDIRVFLFSRQKNYDNLTGLFDTKYLKIRKVNDVQSLVYRLLYDNGEVIFGGAITNGKVTKNPVTGEEVEEKLISAAIVGLGMHGQELLRSLTWFGQMFPYRLEITGFDCNNNVVNQMEALYPDMMRPPYNGDFDTVGESHYSIDIVEGIDVNGADFEKRISEIKDVSYIMVALGDDDLNIQVATKLRIVFERLGKHPVIHTIVYNTDKCNLFRNGYQQSGNTYDIFFCGDMETHYSEQCILRMQIEQDAFDKHMVYFEGDAKKHAAAENELEQKIAEAKTSNRKVYKQLKNELQKMKHEHAIQKTAYENSFWRSDYNYRSSTASVIHRKFKKICKLPGADKTPAERSPADRELFRIVEHQRWNAYVRSEGYVFAPVRNKLAKTHHLLIPFYDLDLSEQQKDDD